MKRLFIALYGVLAAAGCDPEFDPKGPFLDRIVVYSVLSAGSNRQIVRLERTYNPPGFNPLEHTQSPQVWNAQVSVSIDTTTYVLRDTVLPRSDLSRYQDSIRAFVGNPLPVVRGRQYVLTIVSPDHGTLTANTSVPGTGSVTVRISSQPILTNPFSFREDVQVAARVSLQSEGHRVQMFVEYDNEAVNPPVVLREEVPLIVENHVDCLTFDATYPILRRREQLGPEEVWTFPRQSYIAVLRKIFKMHGGQIKFRRAFFVLVQADRHLYRYSSLVNGFQDEFSIRVDQPNYTNVEGGLGVFGSFAVDSSWVSLPQTIPGLSCD